MELKYRCDLPALMKEFKLPMIGVEIGVAEGYFSQDLLANGLDKLYMVDNWATIKDQRGDASNDQEWHDKNYRAAMFRIEKHKKKCVILRGMSEAMSIRVPDASLGLVYIDGDHSYSGVWIDMLAWLPKLVPFGIMAFHDYLSLQYGVNGAVKEFAAQHGFEINVISETKDEDAGAWFRVGESFRL